MKIIGATNGGFILEASKDEVANLLGHGNWYFAYESSARKINQPPKQGDEIAVLDIFKWLKNMEQYEERLVKTADSLQVLADQIRPLAVLKRTIDEEALAGPQGRKKNASS